MAGLTGFRVYGLMPAGLTAIPVWLGGEGFANVLRGGAVVVVAFAVAFIVQRFIGYEQPTDRTTEQVTA